MNDIETNSDLDLIVAGGSLISSNKSFIMRMNSDMTDYKGKSLNMPPLNLLAISWDDIRFEISQLLFSSNNEVYALLTP